MSRDGKRRAYDAFRVILRYTASDIHEARAMGGETSADDKKNGFSRTFISPFEEKFYDVFVRKREDLPAVGNRCRVFESFCHVLRNFSFVDVLRPIDVAIITFNPEFSIIDVDDSTN